MLFRSNITAAECSRYDTKGMPAADYVLVEVADTGTGIPPEIIDKIFEPFFSTKEVGKGTGLGLSTVYGIVKQAGGGILVSSGPGQGATFRIVLPPAQGGDTERSAPTQGRQRTALAGQRVLIVEDQDDVRTFARDALAAQGCDVLEAASGDAALALAWQQTAPIDLLVTDVVLGGMNGRELSERIVKLHPTSRV